MTETLKLVHSSNLVRWAAEHPEAVVFSADLTASTEILDFKNRYPDRFYSMGLTEQNMMSWAGGMAREGFIPLVHTFAVFMYRRALDQISISIAYPNLPVRMFGFLPGLTTPGGVSHQAIDDINVMRGLPNMTVIETGDATDVESVLAMSEQIDGPIYFRMLRGEMPRLFPATQPTRFNRARVLSSEGTTLILSSGICTEEVMKANRWLAAEGIDVRHLHITTLKPFDDPLVLDAIKSAEHVITFENHSVIGGLGSAVADLMATHGIGVPLRKLGLNDTFLHGASRAWLQKEYGLLANDVIRVVGEMRGRTLEASEDELVTIDALTGSESEAL